MIRMLTMDEISPSKMDPPKNMVNPPATMIPLRYLSHKGLTGLFITSRYFSLISAMSGLYVHIYLDRLLR